jgi:hypothetical protein
LAWNSPAHASSTTTKESFLEEPGRPGVRDRPAAKDAVWIFHGEGADFACAAFRTKQAAVRWIGWRGVSGVLTSHSLDVSAYDWAVQRGSF